MFSSEVSLWDVRYMTIESIKPVLQFEHPKALTSAFFSASGTKMVTTCNDDAIRIFNTSKLNADATSKLYVYFGLIIILLVKHSKIEKPYHFKNNLLFFCEICTQIWLSRLV